MRIYVLRTTSADVTKLLVIMVGVANFSLGVAKTWYGCSQTSFINLIWLGFCVCVCGINNAPPFGQTLWGHSHSTSVSRCIWKRQGAVSCPRWSTQTSTASGSSRPWTDTSPPSRTSGLAWGRTFVWASDSLPSTKKKLILTEIESTGWIFNYTYCSVNLFYFFWFTKSCLFYKTLLCSWMKYKKIYELSCLKKYTVIFVMIGICSKKGEGSVECIENTPWIMKNKISMNCLVWKNTM